MSSKESVSWHSAAYDLNGNSEEIDVCLSDSSTVNDERPLLIVTGLGETHATTEKVAGSFSGRPVAVVNIGFPDTSAEGISHTASEAPLAAAKKVKEVLGWDEPITLAGVSLGAGIALKSASGAPDEWDGVALITPFGFNNEELGETPRDRQRTTQKRLIKNTRAIRDNETENITESAPFSREYFEAIVTYGVTQDGVPLLRRLGSKALVVVGAQDIIFPPREVIPSLASQGLGHLVHEVPGMHYQSSTPGGLTQITQSLKVLNRRELEKPSAYYVSK